MPPIGFMDVLENYLARIKASVENKRNFDKRGLAELKDKLQDSVFKERRTGKSNRPPLSVFL